MIRKTDALLASLSTALGHTLPTAPPPASTAETRQLCKVPTTQSEAAGAVAADTVAMPAQEGGASARGRKRPREALEMEALVAKAAAAAAAAEAVVGAEAASDEEGVPDAAPTDPREDSEHNMRATHAALDMWRTLVTNAKTPTSFPKDDPVASFGASS